MVNQQILIEEGHQRLVRARHGYLLYNRHDTVIGRLIETYGEYFEAEVDVFRRFIAPGDFVMDVGANIGTHSLAMARLAGPAGVVMAFEPQRLVYQTLCANMALNSLSNVYCINAAVGATAGRLDLAEPAPEIDNNFGGAELSLLAQNAGAPPIEQIVLDDVRGTGPVRLIKIDVEGMEIEVLRGARNLIAEFRPILYVENDRIAGSPALLAELDDLGYACWWHLPPYVTSDNFFQERSRIFPIAFIDRGGPAMEPIGFAINLLCAPRAHQLAVRGLRPASNVNEHPCMREHVASFTRSTGMDIPVISG